MLKAMLEAAKTKHLSDRLRKTLEPPRAEKMTAEEMSGTSSDARHPSRLVAIKKFTAANAVLSGSLAVRDGAWSAEVKSPQTLHLFEVADPGAEDCTVFYRAKLRTKDFKGQVYLEMWCRFPGLGEAFSRGLDNTLSGTTGWISCEIPFFLKAGERPDLIRLNVVAQGTGTVQLKNVELLRSEGTKTQTSSRAERPDEFRELVVARADYNAARTKADDDIDIRHAIAAAKLAKANYEFNRKANTEVPGSVPQARFDELLLRCDVADLAVEKAKSQHRADAERDDIAKAVLDAALVKADMQNGKKKAPVAPREILARDRSHIAEHSQELQHREGR